MMLPQRVWKRPLTTSAKIDGIKNKPNNAALAITRHFTSEEMACESNASNKMPTTLLTKIAAASERLPPSQPKPSRYAWNRKNNNCGIQVIAESRINRTDIFPSTYSVRVNGPPLVSRDLRNNALPLYLCRPFTRTEDVLGKMSVLLILLSAITWIPQLLLFLFH